MKKVISILLSFCLMLGVGATLAGCGGNKGFDGIVITYINLKDEPDYELVTNKAAEYIKEKIGVNVKFKPLFILDQSMYTTWLAANEQIDVMVMALESPSTFIKDKRIRELDTLMTEENAPYILDLIEEGVDLKVSDNSGKTYGIGTIDPPTAGAAGYIVRKDVLEGLGLYTDSETKAEGKYYQGQKIEYSDLTKIFAGIKKEYPNTSKLGKDTSLPIYPCGNLPQISSQTNCMEIDLLGGDWSSGGLVGTNSITTTGEVVNAFTSPEYKEYINQMGAWQEAGYMHPDAATTQESLSTFFKSGQFVGTFSGGIGLQSQYEADFGVDLVQLNLTDYFYAFSQPPISMTIPSRSKHAEEAMKFMNLSLEDHYLMNLLYCGIEGTHYEYVSKEERIVKKIGDGSKYGTIPGVWGDKRFINEIVPQGLTNEEAVARQKRIREQTDFEAAEGQKNRSKGIGFVYDPEKQAPRITSINTVIAKYDSLLRVGKGGKAADGTWTGAGTDYAKFISELEKAGINTVVKHKNDQFQAWLAKQ